LAIQIAAAAASAVASAAAAATAAAGAATGCRIIGNPFIFHDMVQQVAAMPQDEARTAANIESYFAGRGYDQVRTNAGNLTGRIDKHVAQVLAKHDHGAVTYAIPGVTDEESINHHAKASRELDIEHRNSNDTNASPHPDIEREKVSRGTCLHHNCSAKPACFLGSRLVCSLRSFDSDVVLQAALVPRLCSCVTVTQCCICCSAELMMDVVHVVLLQKLSRLYGGLQLAKTWTTLLLVFFWELAVKCMDVVSAGLGQQLST
jgi:hypothetical protein